MSKRHTWALEDRVEVRIDHDGLAVEGGLGSNAHDDVGQVVVGICDVRARKHHVDAACCLLSVNLGNKYQQLTISFQHGIFCWRCKFNHPVLLNSDM